MRAGGLYLQPVRKLGTLLKACLWSLLIIFDKGNGLAAHSLTCEN